MKSIVLSAVVALLATVPAIGGDVPFAEPPLPKPGQPMDTTSPSLGDIMGVTQLRHIKLWYAGKSNNWELVNYEVGQIKDSFLKAAILYVNIPVEYIQMVNEPLSKMSEASAAKDFSKFSRNFSELTTACNSCHAAGHVAFIRVQIPNSSPFSDQVWVNDKK